MQHNSEVKIDKTALHYKYYLGKTTEEYTKIKEKYPNCNHVMTNDKEVQSCSLKMEPTWMKYFDRVRERKTFKKDGAERKWLYQVEVQNDKSMVMESRKKWVYRNAILEIENNYNGKYRVENFKHWKDESMRMLFSSSLSSLSTDV
ncbi:Hypothetical predicted protein [Paramuricea clavata]|uniref:Uncharacterized protein n=1 Tax=Paramuricea clavata TaxID=317549 RepID=A0A6S7GJA0_PARCT|nr:Hypothetical predicted protein [Paramuricea clavata]